MRTASRPKTARERLAEFDAKGRDQRFREHIERFDTLDAAARGVLLHQVEAEIYTDGMRSGSHR